MHQPSASKYGSTQKYAQWIAEALACDISNSKNVNRNLMEQYDVIIHGGGLYSGGLSSINTIVKNYDTIENNENRKSKCPFGFHVCCVHFSYHCSVVTNHRTTEKEYRTVR